MVSAAVWATAVLFGSACGTDGSPTASRPQEEFETPGRRAATLVGYSPVNRWQDVDARDLARLLWSNGLTVTGIEYVPWFQPKTVDCPEKLGGGAGVATDIEAAREFVETMRDFGIVTWINVVNANGCAQRAQGDDWFAARLAEIRERIGTERVLFQAVSEPWVVEEDADRDKMFRWTRQARDRWDGMFSIPAIEPGENEPHWSILHDVVDVHHCHDEELVEHLREGDDSLFLNTDCRTIANPGAERAARFTEEALEAGSNLLIYGFRDEGIDHEVIEAMGLVVAEKGEVVTATPTPTVAPTATATETPVPTPTPAPSPTPTSGLQLPLL